MTAPDTGSTLETADGIAAAASRSAPHGAPRARGAPSALTDAVALLTAADAAWATVEAMCAAMHHHARASRATVAALSGTITRAIADGIADGMPDGASPASLSSPAPSGALERARGVVPSREPVADTFDDVPPAAMDGA